jgi:hypothetical protein
MPLPDMQLPLSLSKQGYGQQRPDQDLCPDLPWLYFRCADLPLNRPKDEE